MGLERNFQDNKLQCKVVAILYPHLFFGIIILVDVLTLAVIFFIPLIYFSLTHAPVKIVSMFYLTFSNHRELLQSLCSFIFHSHMYTSKCGSKC